MQDHIGKKIVNIHLRTAPASCLPFVERVYFVFEDQSVRVINLTEELSIYQLVHPGNYRDIPAAPNTKHALTPFIGATLTCTWDGVCSRDRLRYYLMSFSGDLPCLLFKVQLSLYPHSHFLTTPIKPHIPQETSTATNFDSPMETAALRNPWYALWGVSASDAPYRIIPPSKYADTPSIENPIEEVAIFYDRVYDKKVIVEDDLPEYIQDDPIIQDQVTVIRALPDEDTITVQMMDRTDYTPKPCYKNQNKVYTEWLFDDAYPLLNNINGACNALLLDVYREGEEGTELTLFYPKNGLLYLHKIGEPHRL